MDATHGVGGPPAPLAGAPGRDDVEGWLEWLEGEGTISHLAPGQRRGVRESSGWVERASEAELSSSRGAEEEEGGKGEEERGNRDGP